MSKKVVKKVAKKAVKKPVTKATPAQINELRKNFEEALKTRSHAILIFKGTEDGLMASAKVENIHPMDLVHALAKVSAQLMQ